MKEKDSYSHPKSLAKRFNVVVVVVIISSYPLFMHSSLILTGKQSYNKVSAAPKKEEKKQPYMNKSI